MPPRVGAGQTKSHVRVGHRGLRERVRMNITEELRQLNDAIDTEATRLHAELGAHTTRGISTARELFIKSFGRLPVAGENVVRELARRNVAQKT